MLTAAAVAIAALLLVALFMLAEFDSHLGAKQDRIAGVLEEQSKLLQQHLSNIASRIAYEPDLYIPPTVRFCDLCRKEYPESTRWWTFYPSYLSGHFVVGHSKLCAYPQQKKKPEDKWLHGEECVVAELRAYMDIVQRAWQRTISAHKQTRDYKDSDETERVLVVSSCNHCGKEYSESDFYWTVKHRGMEIEIHEGFLHDQLACLYYFCSQECVVAALRVFIGTQLRTLPLEAWETYGQASAKSVRHSTPRQETPGCQETRRGGGLRYILPDEPDYEYSVPLGDSSKTHFVLCNAGFEHTLKEDGFWAYVRTRPPGEWIKGFPVPAAEEVEAACRTFEKMGYVVRRSGDEVVEIVDSVENGYQYRVAPKTKSALLPMVLAYWTRRISGRP